MVCVLGMSTASLLHSNDVQEAACRVRHLAMEQACIEGDEWPEQVWTDGTPVSISNIMGNVPAFTPKAVVKLGYDNEFIYVVFQTLDKYVSSETTDYNGPVSRDACVEFFFAPDISQPLRYFNLEINAGGIPLLGYYSYDLNAYTKVEKEDLERLDIRSSLPKGIVQEIEGPLTWTIACRIPFDLLTKYVSMTVPVSGTVWRANFYKTASTTANPHWMTWSKIDYDKPNFHLPAYFGLLIFD